MIGRTPVARHPSEHVDLYARLGLTASPPPTLTEIRLAYRARILLAHPDRAGSTAVETAQGVTSGVDGVHASMPTEDAHKLNEAWEVLRDENTRTLYDAARRAWISRQRAGASAFAVSYSLDAFDAHYADSEKVSDGGLVDEPAFYTHPCRCSSQFRITRQQLEDGIEIVTCEGCSERCRVEYDVVEE
ncbi:hypothetical protein JCM10908_001442 [Rhodotorula pacifica]|uniref:uncharacterized protein n=1 Tax=Rhodotorula pacifica TaxID=1495444 RepID=UPI0031802082